MEEKETRNFLINRRKELGLSQEYVAGQLNISVTSYRKIENGKTGLYNKKVLLLAEILGTTPAKLLFGYSMIGATVDNVKVNVTKSDGITAIPGDNVSGLLTAIFSYGNTFNNLVVDAQNTDVDTLFGNCKYYSYPAEYEANKFTACTVKAKSLIGLACTDNANKTVTSYSGIDGLTVTVS